MRNPAPGESAPRLPWLPPAAASLGALAREPDTAWSKIRTDPGAVALLARCLPAGPLSPRQSLFPSLAHGPVVLDEALRHLDGSCAVDWRESSRAPIYEASLAYAATAERLAEQTGRVDADSAWAAGLLAPLGWLAMAVGAPERAALDHAAVARRLARRWRLPLWLTAIVGHLALPVENAQKLGAEPELFRLIQLAVLIAQRERPLLQLAVGVRIDDAGRPLGLSAIDVATLATRPLPSVDVHDWTAANAMPLLPDLLRVAADQRRLTDAPVLERLEQDADELHAALENQRRGEDVRLHARKLASLAEFAAGAGHEINNPLAVISGQAQYLMSHETEPARLRSLQTIVGQTQRIHDLLTELMNFARPTPPHKRPMDAGALVREVAAALRDFASDRQVRLDCREPLPPINLHVDGRQLRTALVCLLRNAIEAAPSEGWASLRVETLGDRVEFHVEDNGSGPTPAQREHMFDPFYSGRQAGRGHGLGLPTAWRLAKEHGGEVRFDEQTTGVTRFVLMLPNDVGWLGTSGHMPTAESRTA